MLDKIDWRSESCMAGLALDPVEPPEPPEPAPPGAGAGTGTVVAAGVELVSAAGRDLKIRTIIRLKLTLVHVSTTSFH